MAIDWPDALTALCAAAALAISLKQERENHQRRRREAKDQEGRTVRLSAERADGALLLRINYQPEGDHTVYVARLSAVRPATAVFSKPHWTSMNSPDVVMMPREDFDPRAARTRNMEVKLATPDYGGAQGVGACVAISGLDGGVATVRVQVIDQADSRVVIDLQRTVKA